jgi:hypothetical protein
MDTPREDLSGDSPDSAPALRRRPDSISLATAVAFGVIGFGVIWYATSLFGIGITPDSVRYLSTAQSFLDGHGFTLFNGEPLITSPPLYPIVLAGFRILGIDLILAARILNALLFGLIIVAADLWLTRRFNWRPMGDMMVVGILLSSALFGIAITAWTETLFAFLVLIFLIMLERSDHTPTLRQTVWLAIVAALACLTRYIGVILIPYYWLVLLGSGGSHRLKLRRALAFVAITSAPLILWLIRNYFLSGTLTGNRQVSSFPLAAILGQTASALVQWYYRLGESSTIAHAVITAIIIFVVAFLWLEGRRARRTGELARRLAVPSFAPHYILWLIAIASILDFDSVSNRLVSPAFVPLLVMVFTVMDRLAGSRKSKGLAIRRIIVGAICVLGLGTWLISSVEIVNIALRDGAGGYATDRWQNSELMDYLEESFPVGTLYTNGPDVVYLMTGRKARLSPRKTGPSLSGERLGLDEFKAVVEQEGAAYLAWFSEMGRPYMYSPKDLSEHFLLQPVRRVDDGTLYRALPLPEN